MFAGVHGGSLDGLSVDEIVILDAISHDATKNDQPHDLGKSLAGELSHGQIISHDRGRQLHFRPRGTRIPFENGLCVLCQVQS